MATARRVYLRRLQAAIRSGSSEHPGAPWKSAFFPAACAGRAGSTRTSCCAAISSTTGKVLGPETGQGEPTTSRLQLDSVAVDAQFNVDPIRKRFADIVQLSPRYRDFSGEPPSSTSVSATSSTSRSVAAMLQAVVLSRQQNVGQDRHGLATLHHADHCLKGFQNCVSWCTELHRLRYPFNSWLMFIW